MWNIPPIIGQKVMLNPSYAHYQDFNRTQARNRDGYILSVQGMDIAKWLIGTRRPTLTVLWENGNENVYELDALLPIDLFKTIERVEFKGGSFLNVCSEKARNYIAERVIMKNDDVKHYSFFDKEKRLDVLRKAELAYTELNEAEQNNESVQMKYMSILEEIERSKRAEEVVLFLESEGVDDVSTRKKHVSQEHTSPHPVPSERSDDVEGMLRDWEMLAPSVRSTPGEITQLFGATGTGVSLSSRLSSDVEEIPPRPANESFREYLARTGRSNPHQLGEVAMSSYMEEMTRFGRDVRIVREELEESRRAHLSQAELLAILNDEQEDI